MMKNTVLISVLYSSLLVASAAQTKESAAGEHTPPLPNKTLLALCTSKDGMQITFPHAILYPDRMILRLSDQFKSGYILSEKKMSAFGNVKLTADIISALFLIKSNITKYNKSAFKLRIRGNCYSVNPERLSVEKLPKQAHKKAGALAAPAPIAKK
jgi:hypothetical protein